jgi:hypothetical protein
LKKTPKFVNLGDLGVGIQEKNWCKPILAKWVSLFTSFTAGAGIAMRGKSN